MYVGHGMIGMCSSVDVDVWRETKKDEVVDIAITRRKEPSGVTGSGLSRLPTLKLPSRSSISFLFSGINPHHHHFVLQSSVAFGIMDSGMNRTLAIRRLIGLT